MNNELIFKGNQIFMDREIPIIYGGFGENQKCLIQSLIILLIIYIGSAIVISEVVLFDEHHACEQDEYYPFKYLPNFIKFNKKFIIKRGVTIKILIDFIISVLIYLLILPVEMFNIIKLTYRKCENIVIFKFKDRPEFIDLRQYNKKH